MRRSIAASAAVHGGLAALLVALATHSTPVPPRTSPTLEVIDVIAPPAPSAVVQRPQPPATAAGGKRGRARSARRASHSLPAGGVFEDPRGAIRYDDGGGGTGGSGGGHGTGSGIGFGEGGSIAPPPVARLVVPPAPKASKARPARLIFPSRQRDVDDGELFVMAVTVDRDGYVAGARLIRGFGGHRDEVASEQIWRFRYDPARDDDGRPVESKIEQRFLVQ